MAIQFKDYYHILGVRRSASEDEIRKAFRQLARLYHPDVTGNDVAAEDKFKELNEAYEVLGDAAKRKKYDDLGDSWKAGADFMPPGFENFNPSTGSGSAQFTFRGTQFSDFFEQLFGNNAQFQNEFKTDRIYDPLPQPEEFEPDNLERGGDLEADILVTLEEAAKGAVRPISLKRGVLCDKCFGVGNVNGHQCFNCNGSGQAVRTETYQVKIPAGIRPGHTLRVQGKGDNGEDGGTPGDLYLKVRFAKHHEFRFEKGMLYYDLEVTPWEAVVGTSATIPTLNGRVNIKIPPGTQSGHKLRVRGRGLPKMGGGQDDLVAVVRLQVPANMTPEQRELCRKLAGQAAPA